MPATYVDWPLINTFPAEGMGIGAEFSTTIATSLSGIEQRNQNWDLPRHTLKLRFDKLQNGPGEVEDIYNFYLGRKGAKSKFAVFDYDDIREWGPISFGAGTGAATTFYLPCHEDVSDATVKIYDNTTLVPDDPPPNGYALSDGGADGNYRKKIVFDTAPANGHDLTVVFVGRRFFVVRFATDKLSYEVFSSMLYTVGVDLIELKGE